VDLTEFVKKRLLFRFQALFLVLCYVFASFPAARAEAGYVLIERKTCRLLVLDEKGKPVLESPVGLGRGGLAVKQSMADCITPTGEFKVDIVLCKESRFNAVAGSSADKYKADSSALAYLSSSLGLARLFANMNSLDFNGDGKPDCAYGAAYVGLDSGDSGLSGPKLSKFKGKPYWFSIAVHGTLNESSDIGKFCSGGCIQVPAANLMKLIKNKSLQIGTRVVVE
jgi:hypothetical protein